MVAAARAISVTRLVVIMPSWVGDVVMATPVLRALRGLYPDAHIAALCSDMAAPLLADCPWLSELMPLYKSGDNRGMRRIARTLRAAKYDTAVILPNSFRAALLVRLAGIANRVGYNRDGRGWLLNHYLTPLSDTRRFIPVSTVEYYLALARYLGAPGDDATLQLFTSDEDDADVARLLRDAAVDSDARKLLLITPGANYGDAKLWPAEQFAAVADRCARTLGLTPAVSGAPGERAILDSVISAARTPIIDLPALGIDLKRLKSVLRHTALTLTNDTGPRHMSVGMGVPVVTVFGPTDPAWTKLDFPLERQVAAGVFCQPCQLKRCPIDHRCMTEVTADTVYDNIEALLRQAAATR